MRGKRESRGRRRAQRRRAGAGWVMGDGWFGRSTLLPRLCCRTSGRSSPSPLTTRNEDFLLAASKGLEQLAHIVSITKLAPALSMASIHWFGLGCLAIWLAGWLAGWKKGGGWSFLDVCHPFLITLRLREERSGHSQRRGKKQASKVAPSHPSHPFFLLWKSEAWPGIHRYHYSSLQ